MKSLVQCHHREGKRASSHTTRLHSKLDDSDMYNAQHHTQVSLSFKLLSISINNINSSHPHVNNCQQAIIDAAQSPH